jgi:hypothetical protein
LNGQSNVEDQMFVPLSALWGTLVVRREMLVAD